MKKLRQIQDIWYAMDELSRAVDLDKKTIAICNGTGCHAYKCNKVTEAFNEAIKKYKLEDKVEVKATGCHGFCERGTVVVIHSRYSQNIFYQKIKPEDAEEIVKQTIMEGKIIENLRYVNPVTSQPITFESDVPFYTKQKRLVLKNNGKINPASIEDALRHGSYAALAQVLPRMSPEQVIEEIKKSGLRGRGGAGFPTGKKWELTRNSKSDKKYVICNADEGDPGAYMDRSLLEGNPHSVIEGMLIGAYAIGAQEGIVYVRNEYPLAVENLEKALTQAYDVGLLGENILGTGLNFKIKISRGGGAFVCGEETALIASVEGKPGEPKIRPPYPAEEGLHGKPTNINNVETWANIPIIINRGAEWYSKIGTEKSKGTKIFSLVGKINNTGLVEVPMGTTLKEIVDGIGGGIPNNRKLKAVQIGGPSGGCVPAHLIDTPVDYEKLTDLGAMMGSGGLIVMDEDTCMVDVAKYFLSFLQEESCGKCVSCREGITQMKHILTEICDGRGKEEHIPLLENLADYIKSVSLCGLGNTSPNPVLTTLKYFRHEYESHIKDKRCEAGVCKELTTYTIDKESCASCGKCAKQCPKNAISNIGDKENKTFVIDEAKCNKCGTCRTSCKEGAVKVK